MRAEVAVPQSKLSREEFDVLVKQSELPFDEATKAELYSAYGLLEQMKTRVRARAASPRTSEPAHRFEARAKSRGQ
jgi:hypothetical protein